MSDYDKLDLSTSSQDELARARIDAWFAELAPEARASIKGEFISKTRSKHLSGFFELYLHQSLRGLSDPLQIHIASDGSGTLPDFGLGTGARLSWIEAVVAAGDSVVEHRTRTDQLYDTITRHSRQPGFLLEISMMAVGGPDSPGRPIVTDIDEWLAKFDPDHLPDPPPCREFTASGGWRFRVRAGRQLPENRGPGAVIGSTWEGYQEHEVVGNDRTVIVPGWRRLDEVQPLLRSLERKAAHPYATGTDPFIVAVLAAGDLVDERDLRQALFGRSAQSGLGAPVHQVNGLWVAPDGTPRNQHVSAVAAAIDLSPRAVEVVQPVVYINPWATRSIPADLLPWSTTIVNAQGQLTTQPARLSASALLGLHIPTSN